MSQIPPKEGGIPPKEGGSEDYRKRFLIILDVNGILIDRRMEKKDKSAKQEDAKFRNFYVHNRPYMREVVELLTKDFEVGVWSSMTSVNLDLIVDHVFGDLASKLLFVWDQTKCTRIHPASEWREKYDAPQQVTKPVFLKELSKLKEDPKTRLFFPNKVLLIDDSSYKVAYNDPFTAIHPLAFNVDKDEEDTELRDLHSYLKLLSRSHEVPRFIEKHPYVIWKDFSKHLTDISTPSDKVDPMGPFLHWCMQNRDHAYSIVSIWDECLFGATPKEKAMYIGLVDEIIKKDRLAGSQDYANIFWSVYPRAVRHAIRHGEETPATKELLKTDFLLNKHIVQQFDKVFQVRKYLFPHIPREQSLTVLWEAIVKSAGRNQELRPAYEFLQMIVPMNMDGRGISYYGSEPPEKRPRH